MRWILSVGKHAVCAILLLPALPALSEPIPPALKSVVAFVFVAVQRPNGDQLVPYGTGFFVSIPLSITPPRAFVYFVTAKHVLQKEDKQTHAKSWLPEVYVRLNKQNGGSEYIKLPIVTEGKNKNIFVNDDASVDLAVVPVVLDTSVFDVNFLPNEMITTEMDFKTLGIQEGSEVFFTGLFSPYVGVKRNYPVFRFGRVALLTDEKIPFAGGPEANLYLVETGSYGGNSGSPVYFYFGMERGNSLNLGPPIIKLAGVMEGTYLDAQEVIDVQTAQTPVSRSSMGIAAVVPAYKLHEILFGDELTKQRKH